MIVYKEEWAFVSTRKCGTNTLYEHLPGERSPGPFHIMPTKRVADLHWTIVRDPYERAVSIWASTSQGNHDKYRVKTFLGDNNPKFSVFVEKCLVPKNKGSLRDRFLFMNQTDWLNTGIIDQFGHLETLYEDVKKFTGLDINLTVENKSRRKSVEEYLTPEVVEMIDCWAEEDFKNFGYERRSVL